MLLVCAAAPWLAAPARAAVAADYYGMNAQFLFKAPPETWERHMAAVAATGVGVVRIDAQWGKVEPKAPVDGTRTYYWDRPDAIVTALARNGLRWYPTIAYGTTWAGTVAGDLAWMSAPRDPADYAAFVQAFAARYGSTGTFWTQHPDLPRLPVTSYEIWNEPNVEKFFPGQATAPERYADLFVAAAAAVRRADPAGRPVIGGLSSVNVGEFIRRMAARQPALWSHVSAVAYHPYGGSAATSFDRINTLRGALRLLGVGQLPIEVTETGWAVPPTTEAHRAAQMRALAEGLPGSGCGVTRFIPYTWVTTEIAAEDPEQWFGIANLDGSLKPSGEAYRSAVLAMRGGNSPAGGYRCAADPSAPVTETPVAEDPVGKPPRKPKRTLKRVDDRGGRVSEPTKRLRVRVRPGKVRPRRLPVRVRCSSRCRVVIRVTAPKRGARRSRNREIVLRRKRARVSHSRTVRVRLYRGRLARAGSRDLGPRRLRVRAHVVGMAGQRTELQRRVAVGRKVRRAWARPR